MRSLLLRIRRIRPRVRLLSLLIPLFVMIITAPKCISFHFSSNTAVSRHMKTGTAISNSHSNDHISLSHRFFYRSIPSESSDDAHDFTQDMHDDDRCAPPPVLILPTTRMRTCRRRYALLSLVTTATLACSTPLSISNANAYTPDSDELRESLYLISRVH